MRILLVFVSFIITGALCFYAGLKVGEAQPVAEVSDEAETYDSSEPIEAETVPAYFPDTEDTVQLRDMPAEEVMETSPMVEEMKARAAEKIIVITDNQGREMEVEVLDVSERGLRVRRQIDYLAVIIPWEVLSPKDRAFAEFLLNKPETVVQAKAEAKNNEISEQDKKIYELIFGKQ